MKRRDASTYKDALLFSSNYIWGDVVRGYEVGPYQILEFHPRKTRGVTVLPEADPDELSFHVFVDGHDTCSSYHSLDAALAGAIAYRSEGANHRGDRYFIAALEAMAEGRA